MCVRGKRAGNAGKGSGWLKFLTRRFIYRRERYRCIYCQVLTVPKSGSRCRTIDHVVPRSEGGKDQISNLVLACMRCNRWKANDTLIDFAYYLAVRSSANPQDWREVNRRVQVIINRVNRAIGYAP